MLTQSDHLLFSLLRSALGTSPVAYNLSAVTPEQWKEVIDLAFEHGVDAISMDGYHKCLDEGVEDSLLESDESLEDLKFEWFGSVLQAEEDAREYRKAIADLARFYQEQDIRLMILKGYGLSHYYPVPEHRPVGDIDIYNFGQQKMADHLVHEKLGIEIDNSHLHHTVFSFQGYTVENHYEFVTVDRRSSRRINDLLSELSEKKCDRMEVDCASVYLPHPDFNALFLAKHCSMHFAATEMSLRQLLDWLLFVKAEHARVDWPALYKELHEENLHRFVNAMNTIGVKYLGFDKELFYELSTEDALVSRIVNDILHPEFTEREDGSLLSGLWVKPRRWWHNRWKHRICYPDSLFSTFILTLITKLRKPSHFRR